MVVIIAQRNDVVEIHESWEGISGGTVSSVSITDDIAVIYLSNDISCIVVSASEQCEYNPQILSVTWSRGTGFRYTKSLRHTPQNHSQPFRSVQQQSTNYGGLYLQVDTSGAEGKTHCLIFHVFH
jgi:hypothetical protein